MLQTVSKIVSILRMVLSITTGMAVGADKPPTKDKTAILFLSFGTTIPPAVKTIVNVGGQVK